MNDEKFHELDTISDKIHDKFESLYGNKEFQEIESDIQKLLKSIHEKYSIEFNLSISIYDSDRDKSIQMYRIGITGSGKEGNTYQFSEGYNFNRYIINGHIIEIPHNICPNCWADWDFKRKNSSCPECGVIFGKEVKLLIDSDECPYCSEGKIYQKNSKCTKCDFIADDDLVVWG